MLLTQETDYALRILRSLSNGSVVSVQQLAEQEDLPRHFAHKIAKKLEKAGIIHIKRGITGGCSLACDLGKTSLYDLVSAIENRAMLSNCMGDGHICQWRESHGGVCRTHNRLCMIQKQIDQELRSRSLLWVLGFCQE